MLEYFFPIILIFGLLTSYEDIYQNRIKNRNILLVIILALGIYVISLSNSLTQHSYINLNLIIYGISNSAITLFLGFILWKANFWSAGDAKLLFAYSVIIPITTYEINPIPFFPAFFIIFNTFIPFLGYSLLMTSRDLITSTKIHGFFKTLSIREIIENIVFFFSVTWIGGMIPGLLGIEKTFFTTLIFSGVVWYTIWKMMFKFFPKKYNWKNTIIKKKPLQQKAGAKLVKTEVKSRVIGIPVRSVAIIIVSLIIGSFRIFFEMESMQTSNFWYSFIGYYIILTLLRRYVYSEATNSRRIHVLHLKRGMNIDEKIIEKDGVYVIVDKKDKGIQSDFPMYLDEESVRQIAKLYKKRKLSFNKVHINQTIPFAPLMFLGAILTIIAGGAFTSLF
ncbi:prepilin peptidase [Candidatus Woesearchaeota archaeon]|nr:prepilin peptidase [Candidatus Woesearchaeota archaeon]